MASHATSHETFEDPPTLSAGQTSVISIPAVGAAAVGFIAAFALCWGFGGLRRFMLAYLVAYVFVLSLSLGGLVFVMIQHQFRAGWSVNVRRVPEALAANLRWLWVGVIPILVTLVIPAVGDKPTLYPWAAFGQIETSYDGSADEGDDLFAGNSESTEAGQTTDAPVVGGEGMDDLADNSEGEARLAAAGDEAGPQSAEDAEAAEAAVAAAGPLGYVVAESEISVYQARHHLYDNEITKKKLAWLNSPFFVIRLAIYFGVWAILGAFYWRNSLLQDRTGDPAITKHVQWWTPIGLLAFGLTVTFAAFDLIMSLNPIFYSTIFGVYIFSGAMIGALAVTILVYQFMGIRGLLKKDVTVEHYHDLGKLLFAFVFFWGYIAFSQFMLIWYANIPETTQWFGMRGATTVPGNAYMGAWPEDTSAAAGFGWWRIVIMTLLVAHLLIPFAFLLTRKTKRNLMLLGIASGWMLVMHYVDLYWLIMPEMLVGGWQLLPVIEVLCLLGFGGLFIAATAGALANVNLRPTGDPRLPESMHLHQSF